MTPRDSVGIGPYAAVLAAVLLWGSSFAAVKLVLVQFSAAAYMFFRFAAASVIFGIILARSRLPRIPIRSHARLALMAFFEPGLYYIFETAGLQRTTASSASIIIASLPVVVVLLAALILKEPLNRRSLLGALLSVVGVLLLSVWDGVSSLAKGNLVGNALVFLAVLSASGYMIVARFLLASLSALQITAFQIIYGTIFFLPGLVWMAATDSWPTVDALTLGALAFLVVGATLGAFLCYNAALSHLGAGKTAVFLNGIPIVAVGVAAIVLGESVSYHHAIAAALVIAGVMISNQRRRKTPPIPAPGVG